jgi:hypothetical protein
LAAPSGERAFEIRYSISYAGLSVASATLKMQPVTNSVRSELVIEEEGLAALFGRNVTTMQATSRVAGAAAPSSFRARYEKPDRTREAVVQWNQAGQITKAVELKRGREEPSEVPSADQSDTVDPLTALLRLRDWLASPGAAIGASTRAAVFDGRKRFDLEIRRIEDAVRGGERLPRVEGRMIPLFGFDKDDRYVSWPGQPPRWFKVEVSGDGRFAPLTVAEKGAPLVVATHDCIEAEVCSPVAER